MGNNQGKQEVLPIFDLENVHHDFLIHADELAEIKSKYEGDIALQQLKKRFSEIPNLKFGNWNNSKFIVELLVELKRQMEISVQNKNCPIRFYIVQWENLFNDKISIKLKKYFENKGYTLSIHYQRYDRHQDYIFTA